MPMTDQHKAEAIGLVVGNLRLRCLLGRAPDAARIGTIADIVFAACDEAEAANNTLTTPMPLDRQALIDYATVKLRADARYASLVEFIPFWVAVVIKLIISLLIDFWLLNKGTTA
jgi:hypothetical protein